MHIKIRGIEVAEVQGAGAVAGELVSAGAANADEAVCARDDDDFVLDSSASRSV